MSDAPQFVPPPAAQYLRPAPPDKLRHVPTLGLLMMLHGGLVLAWVAFCAFAIASGVINVTWIGPGHDEDYVVIGAYTAFGLGALPVAIVELVAGARVRKLRSRKLAIGGLFAAAASFFCGNVFCLPLSLGLLVWGLLVLFDRAVIAAFERVERGEDAAAVLGAP